MGRGEAKRMGRDVESVRGGGGQLVPSYLALYLPWPSALGGLVLARRSMCMCAAAAAAADITSFCCLLLCHPCPAPGLHCSGTTQTCRPTCCP